jgi:hypothetical protein
MCHSDIRDACLTEGGDAFAWIEVAHRLDRCTLKTEYIVFEVVIKHWRLFIILNYKFSITVSIIPIFAL